jgi:hypothetical protein
MLMGDEYVAAYSVGDQLLWGAAEPLRRMLVILREHLELASIDSKALARASHHALATRRGERRGLAAGAPIRARESPYLRSARV